MSSENNLYGVIFDFDGVVIDSSRLHEESWQRLAEEEGELLPPNFFLNSFGMKNLFIISELLGWAKDEENILRLSHRKSALYRERVKIEGITPLPGIENFLKELKELNIPCAIGTSTPKANLELALDLLNFRHYFQAFTTAEDVQQGKPNPEVFVIAAQRIEREPKNCVVIEDAHVGIDAANRGGFRSVAVATTHPLESFAHSAQLGFSSTSDLSASKILELFKA